MRKHVTMIPQDPTMFTGSLRFNLDPFNKHSDEKLSSLLKKAAIDKKCDLDFKVEEDGKNLSVGERQLICIVRAILRRSQVVILDEATANIDVVTEKNIQRLIDEELKGATLLTIAHRLNTVINSDKILVLNEGKLVEFDIPE